MSEEEKGYNTRYASAKYRAGRKDKNYVAYQRYVPKKIKDEIRKWVNWRIEKFEKTGE